MFTIKLMRYNQDGSIIDADILSCPSYSVVYSNEKVEIVPRAMTEGDPTHSMRTIMPRPKSREDQIPYRYDMAFIENSSGKTIDRIGSARSKS